MDVFEVDGSFGEGGGQILRIALAFSAIQSRPIRVTRIRAGREIPGLRPQHVATVHAMGQLFGAQVTGGEVGSSEVKFVPGKVKNDSVKIDMRTAASVTLLLQAAIPAIALSGRQASFEIVGGTDVPWSPTYDYLHNVVRPAFGLIGIVFNSAVHRRGYYPRGGGKVDVQVESASSIKPVSLTAFSSQGIACLVSRCANLPRHVAERQLVSMERVLESAGIGVSSEIVSVEEAGSPGSSVLAFLAEGERFIGGDAIGSRGRPAEDVGRQAGSAFASVLRSGSAVDQNLADMVAPLLCMADRPSTIRIPRETPHLKTVLHVAGLFTGGDYGMKEEERSSLLTIRPGKGHNA